MNIKYKVVHKRGNKRYSVIVNDPWYQVEYKVEEWVSAPFPPGLCVFNNVADAVNWGFDSAKWKVREKMSIRKDVEMGEVEIWKVRVKNPHKKGKLSEIEDYVNRHLKKWIKRPSMETSIFSPPTGTSFADEVILLECMETLKV